jgi:hypothetical protein
MTQVKKSMCRQLQYEARRVAAPPAEMHKSVRSRFFLRITTNQSLLRYTTISPAMISL